MISPERAGIVVTRAPAYTSDALIDLFKAAFPRHPVSRLEPSLAAAFLRGYAEEATFLVARKASEPEELGFLVGGPTALLDRIRVRFIRRYLWRIATSSTHNPPLRRLLLARMRIEKPRPRPHALYQLRFIAVAPQMRGNGVGALLIDSFEESLPKGVGYHAWTLGGEHGGEAFYNACGFVRDVTVDGHVRMYRQILS
jgi:GNAT superfamily N-acetyltransferase